MKRQNQLLLAVCLLVTPPALLLMAWAQSWVTASTAEQTATGILITAIGGVIVGIICEQFLGRQRSGIEQTMGLIAATALSVAAVGGLYLLLIRGPISSIGTPERAVKQILSFTEYLTAQGAGILLSAGLLRK